MQSITHQQTLKRHMVVMLSYMSVGRIRLVRPCLHFPKIHCCVRRKSEHDNGHATQHVFTREIEQYSTGAYCGGSIGCHGTVARRAGGPIHRFTAVCRGSYQDIYNSTHTTNYQRECNHMVEFWGREIRESETDSWRQPGTRDDTEYTSDTVSL